jgi:hypothetical protein
MVRSKLPVRAATVMDVRQTPLTSLDWTAADEVDARTIRRVGRRR